MWYKIKFFMAVLGLSLVVSPSHATLIGDTIGAAHVYNGAIQEGGLVRTTTVTDDASDLIIMNY